MDCQAPFRFFSTDLWKFGMAENKAALRFVSLARRSPGRKAMDIKAPPFAGRRNNQLIAEF
jgi:hypothetical protein